MKPLLNPKKISITIKIKNLIGIKQKNAKIKLIRIDDYFYYKPKEAERETNDEGIAEFKSILQGAYLVQILKNKIFIEQILELRKSDYLKIRLPAIFGLFKKEQKISEGELKKTYQEYRIDTDVCFKCKKKYEDYTDKFLCKYCKKYFCSKHRLPEKHNCWGKAKAPPGAYRTLFSRGQTIVIGK